MNISEYKPRKDIKEFYTQKKIICENLSKKLEMINKEIKQGKRSVDVPYSRLWINFYRSQNDKDLYTLYLHKLNYDNLLTYKSKNLEGKKAKKEELEKCEQMISAISDVFEILYDYYEMINKLLGLMQKKCDMLDADKNTSDFMKQASLQLDAEQIMMLCLNFDEYQQKYLLPITKEVMEYMRGIQQQGFQF